METFTFSDSPLERFLTYNPVQKMYASQFDTISEAFHVNTCCSQVVLGDQVQSGKVWFVFAEAKGAGSTSRSISLLRTFLSILTRNILVSVRGKTFRKCNDAALS